MVDKTFRIKKTLNIAPSPLTAERRSLSKSSLSVAYTSWFELSAFSLPLILPGADTRNWEVLAWPLIPRATWIFCPSSFSSLLGSESVSKSPVDLVQEIEVDGNNPNGIASAVGVCCSSVRAAVPVEKVGTGVVITIEESVESVAMQLMTKKREKGWRKCQGSTEQGQDFVVIWRRSSDGEVTEKCHTEKWSGGQLTIVHVSSY